MNFIRPSILEVEMTEPYRERSKGTCSRPCEHGKSFSSVLVGEWPSCNLLAWALRTVHNMEYKRKLHVINPQNVCDINTMTQAVKYTIKPHWRNSVTLSCSWHHLVSE